MLKSLPLLAQELDEKIPLQNLCGCFNVNFKYAETFSPDDSYQFHEGEKIEGGTELAYPIVNNDRFLSIQHILVVGDSMIVKHWREDWSYENPILWAYTDAKKWIKKNLSTSQVKGQWTQSVWEVSDEPRYQGHGKLINLEDETLWISNADAPLPRREYSVRSDYNILNRTNRIHISDTGYIHEQDNKKIIRIDGTDKLLVEEKGYNTYRKINDDNCAFAKKYWEKNKWFWIKVEEYWTNYLATHNVIELMTKVDGKALHQRLFTLLNEYNANHIDAAEVDLTLTTEIEKYIK